MMDIFMLAAGLLAAAMLGWILGRATAPEPKAAPNGRSGAEWGKLAEMTRERNRAQGYCDEARQERDELQVDYSALGKENRILAKRIGELEGELEDAEAKAAQKSNAVDMLSGQLADAEARLASVDDDSAEQALLARIATLEKEIATLSSDKGNKIMRSESAKYRAIKNVTDPKLWAPIAMAVNAKLKDGGFSQWKNPPTKIKVR